ncbi:N-acetyltransferase [Flavobacterium sp. LM4]|uniref:GNAT family N-acetyltransferase n=1 Tax=Flavobacterium sp. LM4 TaxID=1938609 RepID=UPI000993AEF7|nr:GNAT family N-acetyltransferase [Flavobacterium sp. LM4]OOV19979.1 GNAT family N-acetyltransferase [Flavobacterium sp. LM4]
MNQSVNSNFSIVEIKPGQFNSIEGLIRESKLIDDMLSINHAIGFIKSKLERNKVKIFACQNEVNNYIAFVVLVAKINPHFFVKYNWHISYLYVKKECRREKIAYRLMQKTIEYACFTNVEFLSLNVGIDNLSAQNLYQSLYFERKYFLANYYYYELNISDLINKDDKK